MNTRRIALVTVVAATTAFVLSGRQRRQRGEIARSANAVHHLRSRGYDRSRRTTRR